MDVFKSEVPEHYARRLLNYCQEVGDVREGAGGMLVIYATNLIRDAMYQSFLAGRKHQWEVDAPYMGHLAGCRRLMAPLPDGILAHGGENLDEPCTCDLDKILEGDG